MSQAFRLEPLVFNLSKKDIIELHNFLQKHATRDDKVAAKMYQCIDGFVCRDRYMHGSVTINFDENGVAAAEGSGVAKN